MCGAVSAGRLVKVPPLVVTETTTGTSPAPASVAGSSTMIWSKPVVCDPFGTVVVTVNGSPEGATQGLVTLRTAARPPGPFVEVKMSGCAGFSCTEVRMTAPLLKMTTGCVAEAASAGGTTKLIWFGATK